MYLKGSVLHKYIQYQMLLKSESQTRSNIASNEWSLVKFCLLDTTASNVSYNHMKSQSRKNLSDTINRKLI